MTFAPLSWRGTLIHFFYGFVPRCMQGVVPLSMTSVMSYNYTITHLSCHADKILLGHSLGGVVAWACWQGSCTCSSLLRLAASLQLWDAGLCCAWAHSWRHGWGQSLYEKKKIIMIIISSLRIIMIFIMIMAMAMIITKIKMKRTRKKEKDRPHGLEMNRILGPVPGVFTLE